MEYRLYQWIAQQDLEKTTDELVHKAQRWFESLADQDIIELLMTGFIPDTYEENREEEKIFAKLIEVLVAECFSRIGFHSTVVKTKNESEDVRIAAGSQAILVDAKTFRLGRSQIAPNVKDFIKLHTVKGWIKNYNQTHEAKAIGGLVVFPSTHEWIKQSQVYKECSNQQTPVVMLSYEILAYLLQNKQSFNPQDLFSIWNYKDLFPQTINTRNQYWNVMYPAIANIIKTPVEEMIEELNIFQLYYEESVKEARIHLTSQIEKISNHIPQQIEKMNDEEIRLLLEKFLIESETTPLENSMENIIKNRKPFLTNEETNRKETEVA